MASKFANKACLAETHFYSNKQWVAREAGKKVPCLKLDCKYFHTVPRPSECANSENCIDSDCKKLHKRMVAACKFKAKCTNKECKFAHPSKNYCCQDKCAELNDLNYDHSKCAKVNRTPPCNFGMSCKDKKCRFRHISTKLDDPYYDQNYCSYVVLGKRCPEMTKKPFDEDVSDDQEMFYCPVHLQCKTKPITCKICSKKQVSFLMFKEEMCSACAHTKDPIAWKKLFESYVNSIESRREEVKIYIDIRKTFEPERQAEKKKKKEEAEKQLLAEREREEEEEKKLREEEEKIKSDPKYGMRRYFSKLLDKDRPEVQNAIAYFGFSDPGDVVKEQVGSFFIAKLTKVHPDLGKSVEEERLLLEKNFGIIMKFIDKKYSQSWA